MADPKVRFVHAVPGGPAVTLERNGVPEAAATNVEYKYGNQYYDLATSFAGFTLRQVSNNNELATAGFDPSRGHKYTLVALPTATGAELLVIDDPYDKSLTDEDARVRVLNAAVNAQPFDVYFTPVDADLMTATPRLIGVSYKEVVPASGSNSDEVEGGTYRLRLTVEGSKTVIFDINVVVPKNGDWLLVVLPEDVSPATTNAVQVLVVSADDSLDATEELHQQP